MKKPKKTPKPKTPKNVGFFPESKELLAASVRAATVEKQELPPLSDPPTPQEVSPALRAFPARVIGTLLPEAKAIPEEFSSGRTPWNSLVDNWFFGQIPSDVQFHGKDGVDPEKAFIHIDACLRSYEPKHEHKIAGCAYLASCFFEKVVIPSKNKEFKSA